MNDDDLYGPKLTPPPQTSPIVRGAAIAVVTVSLVAVGCADSHNPGATIDSGNPGARVVDAGIYYTPDSGPDAGNPGLGVFDAGVDVGNPGLPAFDAGVIAPDSGNPGDHT